MTIDYYTTRNYAPYFHRVLYEAQLELFYDPSKSLVWCDTPNCRNRISYSEWRSNFDWIYELMDYCPECQAKVAEERK